MTLHSNRKQQLTANLQPQRELTSVSRPLTQPRRIQHTHTHTQMVCEMKLKTKQKQTKNSKRKKNQ